MIKKFLKRNITLMFFTIFVIGLILYFANQQSWKYHLSTDIYGFYFPRADYFLSNLKFGGFSENEYFPGAMFFFILPSLAFALGSYGWEQYLTGLFLINIFLIVIILFIYKKHSFISPYLFLIFLLASGPILLYRHELLVSLILILSILLYIRSQNTVDYQSTDEHESEYILPRTGSTVLAHVNLRNNTEAFQASEVYKKRLIYLSSFLLGIATSVKIFPLLVFPYYLLISFKNNAPKTAILKEIGFYLLGLLSVVLMYLSFGRISDILSALTLNSIKPVHAESIWGTILPLISKLTSGTWAIGKGDHGIFGIDSSYIIFPLNFYNYFFIIPLSIFYVYLFKKATKFKVEIIIMIILLFELFSKILTPQYLFWVIPLFPLIVNKLPMTKSPRFGLPSLQERRKPHYSGFSKLSEVCNRFFCIHPHFKKVGFSASDYKTNKNLLILSSITICFILLLTQYLYPLHYSDLLSGFFQEGARTDLFLILALRNFLLVLLFMQLLIYDAKE